MDTSQIADLPRGVFYKKKSVLTRHRFIKTEVRVEDRSIVLEVIDNRGHWQIDQSALSVLRETLQCPEIEDDEAITLFRHAGCDIHLYGDQIPRGQARLPETMDDMANLYSAYTDMDQQGHFDQDSPDRDRIDWITLKIPSGTHVVDVGCNSGRFGHELIAKGCVVAGVDLAPALVERARLKGVDARLAYAESMPFEDDTFGAAICAELLEHVLRPETVLDEIRRVLISGGQLVGSVPHGAGDWGYEDIGHHHEHLRAYAPTELAEFLSSSGFVDIQLSELSHGRQLPQTIVFACRSAA
ncbi:class I SAM-dependent methyltransferase [Kribbella sp. CA-253562]|uniref:class I SAM-dependent methyltransferase n=1 Tax=Kribbella sp. CA-253562 TaxID=3239942 RepID=UPI003D8EA403